MDELEGLTVIEVGDLVPAAFCGKMLADAGAEVTKVERPGIGDESRRFGPFPGDQPHPEKSGLFLYLNANKRGITLNLETDEGQALFRRLAQTADILVEDTPPRYLQDRGLAYARLREVNDQLIVVSISGFGRTGPYADYLAYDLQMWHASAAGHRFLGDPDREPLRGAWHMGSHWGAVNAAAAALIALEARDLTGKGQFVDVSAVEAIAALSTGSAEVSHYFDTGDWKRRSGNLQAQGVPSGMFKAKDGYVNIMALTPQQWDGLVVAMGSPEWARNPAYQGHYVDRVPHATDIYAGMQKWLDGHTIVQVFESCVKNGVPAAPVSTTRDLLENDHLKQRGYFVECDHPVAGRLKMPGGLVRGPGERYPTPTPAPLLGQHTDQVLKGRLGLSSRELAGLKRRGIV